MRSSGAGPFSLTGHPNTMGGREVGGMANLLSGHRDLDNEQHRKEVAALWGVDAVPSKPGKTAVEMFEAIGRGEIKAAWIACTNPAQSMPDANAVRKALERAEFVVVQGAFRDAETCDYADVLLPAGRGEKEGTVTNSERRISRVRAAVPPPGEARPGWQIAVDFARNEHRESTRGRRLAGAIRLRRAVCACFNIGESQIRAAVTAGASFSRLQQDLKCGTNCGSCIPELRWLVATPRAVA